METIEFLWLHEESSQKKALQDVLGCSGQLLKHYFSSKELTRSLRSKEVCRYPLDLVNHLQINPVYLGPEVRVLGETQDYIVLHKPQGVHCHPLSYSDRDTLLNFLAQKGMWAPLSINTKSYDRGLLYRLDHDTSGLILLAKTRAFFDRIRGGFKTEVKRKLYLAIVEGEFNQEGVWTHYLSASGVKGSKQKVRNESFHDGAEATLSVMKVLSENGKSLLLVNLKTGLRHQIRAQLAHLGFPILGDELYSGRKAERLFLHAWRYEWDEEWEDADAELFDRFFDLNRALQMGHDMLRRI